MSQSSPTPDPVAWMETFANYIARHVMSASDLYGDDDPDRLSRNALRDWTLAHPVSALPATTPSDTPPPKWWEAAALVGPFTPTGEGGNDGMVRNAAREIVADCFGFEARADVIAALLNSVRTSPSEGSAPDTTLRQPGD